ncbi:BamA/TamA family outer membrane protein [Sediminitomix flava]|uniref:Surface antigen-like protein n=1 Tax=Sediminitomix flava TaxID=379075 RepID=A0A315Z6T3_SEDFL|nr:BamA/TamA family outer membrane protein [Sediminitomix flava]PWJ40138.1 surface antigen-like protein [Sediminitomix flava]
MRASIIILILVFVSFYSHAQEHQKIINEDQNSSYATTDTVTIQKNVQLIGVPIVFYSPETTLALGGGGQFFFMKKQNDFNSRFSTMLCAVMYTLRNQFIVEAQPKIFLQKGLYFLDGHFQFRIYPNLFWGIGGNTPESNEEDYDQTSLLLRAALLKRIPPYLNFGLEFMYQDIDITEVKEGGILDTEDINGANGTDVRGVGFVFNVDKRDSDIAATRGIFLQFKGHFYSESFGGSTNFYKYSIDLRKYFHLNEKDVFAAQLYNELTFGNPPFQMLAWYGGGERGRGYFKGRYMDKNLYLAQFEYRKQFFPRTKGVAFITFGEVAENVEDYFKEFRFSGGIGLRWQIKKDNPSLIRFDIGVTREGDSGFYVGVNEVF